MKRILLIILPVLLHLAVINAQTGNTQATAIDLGSKSGLFSYTDTRNTASYTNNYTGQSSNDVYYKFTLTSAMDITISHCGSEVNDTYVHLLNSSGTKIAYNDDYSGDGKCSSTYQSYLKMTNLAAGTYYVVSEGYSQNGSITTNIQGGPNRVEYDMGTKSGSFTYSHTQNTANCPNSYTGRSTNDVFYRFTTTVPMDVVISHCGSSVSDTYVHLLNSSGGIVASNDDYSGEGHCTSTTHSYLKMTNLTPGTYYVVSEGYSQNGNITTQVSGTVVNVQGDSFQDPITAGTFSNDFQYSDTKNTANFSNRHTVRSASDVYYKFTLTRKMSVTITHCGSELADTYMFLLDASGNQLALNDDHSGDGACPSPMHSLITRTLDAGTYYVVSEGYNQSGNITTNITGYTSGEFGYPDIPDAYSPDKEVVASPGGAFSVSPMGGAVYSIPIEVPQGVGGLQPNLSITYNSQAGNGLVGWGCNLSGLSVITRAPKDIYHDGTAKGITNQADEAYTLDGQRLIYSSGTESQEGAVYYPESDPFTKVTVRGTNTNAWFEVQSSDGMKYYYGSTANGRLRAGNMNNVSWYLDYAEDPSGNYMAYDYTSGQLAVYPSTITYGNNKNESTGLSNTVTFGYEERNDKIPFYIGGRFADGCYIYKRLKTITSKTGNSVYRSYELQYDYTSDGQAFKFSRLTAVTPKNGAGEAMKPLTLSWQYLPAFYQTASPVTVQGSSYGSQMLVSADLNGDGLADLVGIHDSQGVVESASGRPVGDPRCYAYIYWASRNTDGNVQFTTGQEYALLSDIELDFAKQRGATMINDFNGDGVNDLLVPFRYGYNALRLQFVGGTLEGKYLTCPLGSADMPLYATADINNDGKGDIVILKKGQSNGQYGGSIFRHDTGTTFSRIDFNVSLPATPEKLFVSDFNGDGMQDIMVFYTSGYTIFWNQGDGITTSTFSDSNKKTDTSTGAGYWTTVRSGDFNGDGLMDFIMNYPDNPNWYLKVNRGNGTFMTTQGTILDIYDQSFTSRDDNRFDCMVYDFDFDGKSDVIITKAMYTKKSDLFSTWGEFNKTRTYWFRAAGTVDEPTLAQVASATSNREEDALWWRYVPGDFNGDGQVELMNYGYNCYSSTNADADPVWRMYRNPGLSPASGKVRDITDMLSGTTNIIYAPLTDSGIYTKETSLYPVADYAVPLHAVKTLTTSNGAAGTMTTNYRYKGLKVHLQGRGILGMASQTASNTLGIVTESGVKAWNTNFYIPSQTYTQTTVDGKTAETSRTITVADKGSKKYFAYPSTKTEKDLDGNTVTTTYQFNTADGYMTEEKADFGGNMYKTVQYGNYILAGNRWQPQLVTSIQKHTDDASTFTQKTAYTYNTAKGYRTQAVENQGSSLPLTTDYTYDTFGNVLTSKATGSGITPVTNYYNYDPTKRFVIKTYTSPVSEVRTYTYNTWGNVLTEKDETNASDILTTTHSYDNWGNRIATVYPDGQKATVRSGWNNEPAKRYFVLTQGTGQPWVKTWYDNKGREVLVESIGEKSMAIRRQASYNTKGQVSQKQVQTGGLMITESYTYDARGRIAGKSNSTGQSSTYSYGNRTQTILTNGRTYTKTYDAWGGVKSSVDPVATVTYIYKSSGKPQSVTTGGATFTMTYDNAGNQTGLTDPNAGTSTFAYDAAGRLTRQTDGRGKITANTYDALGRLSVTINDGIATNYTYGTSGNELLRLTKVQTESNYSAYTYDRYGRMLTEKRQVAGESGLLEFAYAYNAQGQVNSVTYPGSLQMSRQYDAYGNLSKVLAGTQTIWERTGETGLVTTSQLGGTLTATQTRNAQGLLTNLKTMKGSTVLHNMDYVFNGATGNLTSRTGMISQAESFTYDNMDRLTAVQQGSAAAMSIGYAANGNITSKTGLGTYTYQTAQPHAIRYVDNTGGLVSNKLQTIAYNSFNKAYVLTDSIGNDAYRLDITYGPDMQRWKTVQKKNNSLQKTIIFAGDYESVTEGSTTRQLYYVSGGDGLAAVYVKQAGQADKVYYVCTDHLGSIIKLVDANGTEVFKASYDAWGRQTIANNSFAFHRGYTGHEHLAEFGLINMNGRMYDPVLGRFLSPDPYVQSPLFSQNFNRYAYCWNNPLRFNDPDGEWIHIAIGALVGGVINWGAHGFRMDMEGLKAFGIGAATGAVGAATFGVGLGAMGVAGAGLTSLGAMGGGGFLAGFGAGAFSYTASMPVLSIGNNIALGDPIPTPEEYMTGLAFSALGGGLTQGLAAHIQGNNFLDGSMKEGALINNAQVAAINESQKAPMAAANDMDAVVMERLGNKTVGNFLDSRIAGQVIDAELTLPKGNFYSVAFETKLPSNLYPGKTYWTHFKAANTALDKAMSSDPTFKSSMSRLGISVPKSSTGSILGKSPSGWVWNHGVEPGVMQLVPKMQHTTGSIYWDAIHPNGLGGMSIWGR